MKRLKESLATLLSLPTIAEQGSIRKAAEHLHISQPALTRKLSRLEQVFKTPLMVRTPRGISITPFGHAAIASARNIEGQLVALMREADATRQRSSGAFRV